MSSEIIDFELWKKVNSIRIKLSLRVWLTALPDLLRSLLFSRVTVESKLDSDLSAHEQNQSAHVQNLSDQLQNQRHSTTTVNSNLVLNSYLTKALFFSFFLPESDIILNPTVAEVYLTDPG